MTASDSGGGTIPGYDVEEVVLRACSADPGLPPGLARELAVLAEEHLHVAGTLDAAELARRLLAELPDAGATPAAVIARAAVDVCAQRGIAPR